MVWSISTIHFTSFSFREHDKGPDEFCTLLLKLLEEKVAFVVSILGSHTNDIPGIRRSYFFIFFTEVML